MYGFMMAECHRCGRLFLSNPRLVPTVRDKNNVKQPLCRTCVKEIQILQQDLLERHFPGVQVWPDPLEGAYEPAPAEEILPDED